MSYYKYNNLDDGRNYYIELTTNANINKKDLDYEALGKLEKGDKLDIEYKVKSEYIYKRYIGSGKIDGDKLHKIELHKILRRKIDFNDLNYVTNKKT